ncbi:hypothetical protein [Aliarcobacter butzleri]|uniref:hypothetical protein n=1 Tax=Aliarcobacter butzleri TaxID=28197 RepID=UPI003AF6ADAA
MYYLLVLFIFLEFVIYFFYKRSKSILSKKDIFPEISEELILKFNSFDKELGWVNKKNTIKFELSHGRKIKYTYNNIGARDNDLPNLKQREIKISTYGDSYCLCREVMDQETWQYYLSQILNTNILNFGVGNYGLDQALLRLKREYDFNPTKKVIMVVTPYTITRITSVWKHFSEFHNVLATKPRFKIDKNDKLVLIPNFLTDKNELKNIKKFENFLLNNDEHIEYCKKNVYSFSFLISFFKNPFPIIKILLRKLAIFLQKLNLYKFSKLVLHWHFYDEIKYKKELFFKNEKLLSLILKEFIEYSKLKNFSPVLLVLPAIEDVRYIQKTNDIYYENFFNKYSDELTYLDYSRRIKNEIEIEKLYISKIGGGHFNAHGNKKISEFLEKELNTDDYDR